jgi:fructose-specific component phosphotransferase system IIB-like protein
VFSHIFVAVMPLWTPFPVTSLTYSIDLLYSDRDAQGPVRAENAANVFAKIGRLIRLRAPEVFDRIGTPELFLRNCRNLFVEQAASKGADTSLEQLDHLPLTQDLAGAAVLVGDTAEAVRFAELFIRTFENEENPYFREQVNGMRRLAKLAVDDLPGARRLLQEWDRHTIGQLKLEAFLDPNRWARFGVQLVNDERSRSLDARRV